MNVTPEDPKAGERAYYARLTPEELRHARDKPFSDPNCGKYLSDFGALLQMLAPPPRRILDLGCGPGWTSILLARAGYQVVGVDIASDAINVARELAEKSNLVSIEFISADYEELRFEEAFDYVLFYDALHHAEDEAKALAAAYRALLPGGVLFAFEPGVGHGRSDGARRAIARFAVHEKDMPPRHVWRHAQPVGFRRHLFLPTPHEVNRTLFRRDFLRAPSASRVFLEKCWGYWRLLTKIARASRSGVTILWK